MKRAGFQWSTTANGIVLGVSEVTIVYFLFRVVDVADSYLAYRGNMGMTLMLRILVSIWPVLSIAFMAFISLWVCVSSFYFVFDERTSALVQIESMKDGDGGGDEFDSMGERGVLFETKFGSIPGAMYQVFLNFMGEFPLGSDFRSLPAQLGILFAILVGVGISGIPMGLIGNALESSWDGPDGIKRDGDEVDDQGGPSGEDPEGGEERSSSSQVSYKFVADAKKIRFNH